MSTVAVIGAGDLGATIAHVLAARDRVRRLVLIDPARDVALGKALDIQQSGAVEGFHTHLSATTDLSAIALADVCIIADRASTPDEEWHGEEGLALLRDVLRYSARAPLICAGVHAPELVSAGVNELHAARTRLFGSAPEALASAIRAIVAVDRRCSPADVGIAVLGVPPDGFVVPWSEASIGGFSLERAVSQADTVRLEARCNKLWPPGPRTLAVAAASAAEAVIHSGRRLVSVFANSDGAFGPRNAVAALPVFLGPNGIASHHVPTLSVRERTRLGSVLKG